MSGPRACVIPYRPRPFQLEIGRLSRTKRFGVLVCHRRFGKTVLGVNLNQQTALMCDKPRPRCAYIGPTYTQAKATAWDYMQHYAQPIPGVGFNQSELRIDYPNAGQSRLYGADNPDSLRGLYLDRATLDEYGLHQPKVFTEVIMPALVDRGGSALFLGTPNGKNQFYDIAQHAKQAEADGDPAWFYREFKASETGLLDAAYLEEARKVMSPDEYAQEFECSFEASVQGAVYAREIMRAREMGRVTNVPYDPLMPVDTDWDLGVGDETAIWFSQSSPAGEVRLIDYYHASGQGLAHFAQILKQKQYFYGTHTAPHDIQVRELGSGHSRLEMARKLGIHFLVCPRLPKLEDGIQAVRALLPRCYFDQINVKDGIEALQHYRWDYNVKIHEFKPVPLHDWASHGADAFRTLAVRHFTPKKKSEYQTLRDQQKDTNPLDRHVGVGGRSVSLAGRRALRRGGY